jgi:hypothetical protein
MAHRAGRSDVSDPNDLESLIRRTLALNCKDDFGDSLIKLASGRKSVASAAFVITARARSSVRKAKNPYDFVKNLEADVGGLGSGRTCHIGAAGRCENWRSVDLADLRRMGLLRPVVGGNIRAMVWDDGDRVDRLGVVPARNGIRFIKRDDQDQCFGVCLSATSPRRRCSAPIELGSSALAVDGPAAFCTAATACAVGGVAASAMHRNPRPRPGGLSDALGIFAGASGPAGTRSMRPFHQSRAACAGRPINGFGPKRLRCRSDGLSAQWPLRIG